MSDSNERDLAERFRALRDAERSAAPSLDRVLSPRRRTVPIWIPAVAAAGLLLAVWAVQRTTPPPQPTLVVQFVPGVLRMPTDFLLDQAAGPRAGDIPRIGDVDAYGLPSVVEPFAPHDSGRLQ